MEKIIHIQAKFTENLSKPNTQKLARVGGSGVPLRQRIFFFYKYENIHEVLKVTKSMPEINLQYVPHISTGISRCVNFQIH